MALTAYRDLGGAGSVWNSTERGTVSPGSKLTGQKKLQVQISSELRLRKHWHFLRGQKYFSTLRRGSGKIQFHTHFQSENSAKSEADNTLLGSTWGGVQKAAAARFQLQNEKRLQLWISYFGNFNSVKLKPAAATFHQFISDSSCWISNSFQFLIRTVAKTRFTSFKTPCEIINQPWNIKRLYSVSALSGHFIWSSCPSEACFRFKTWSQDSGSSLLHSRLRLDI